MHSSNFFVCFQETGSVHFLEVQVGSGVKILGIFVHALHRLINLIYCLRKIWGFSSV